MVEWKKLGEVCCIRTGKLNANAQVENGKYPFFTCDAKPFRIDTFAFDTEAILISGNGSQVGHLNYYKGKFNAYQRTYVIDDFRDVNVFYLFHYLKSTIRPYVMDKSKKGSVPYITLPMLEGFIIPIPSLEEQTRIVVILDTFTSAIDNLKEQIAQQRKQYEYYRDQLLDLEGKPGVEMKTLKDICCKANNIKWKNEKIYAVYQYVDLSSVDTRLNQITDTTEINKENAPSRAQQIIKAGDILLGTTRPTLKRYCQVPKHYDNQICSTGYCVFRANVEIVLSRWIYHNIGNEIFWDYCEVHQQGAGYPCLSNTDAFAYRIPVPPLEEQQRIVSILDTFEASIQNLEAQLKEREKQYEYYRNKLLTFE